MPEPKLVCFVDMLGSEYVSRVLAGMRRALLPAGWGIVVREGGFLSWDERMTLLHAEAHSGEYSAAAFVHFHLTDEQCAAFRAAKLPLGYLGGTLEGVDSVLDDGNEGAYLGTQHLISLGHQRIGLLAADPQVMEARLREIGFHRAMREQKLTVEKSLVEQVTPALAAEGAKAALHLLKQPERPTAIFCTAGDLVAAGVYQAAAQLGLNIPGDLSVLGYDDLPQAGSMHPPLSTLRQPLEEMGQKLAAQLIAASRNIKTHHVQEFVFESELVMRSSTAAPNA